MTVSDMIYLERKPTMNSGMLRALTIMVFDFEHMLIQRY